MLPINCEVTMTKQEILQELQNINIDATNYIYTENYNALNSLEKED